MFATLQPFLKFKDLKIAYPTCCSQLKYVYFQSDYYYENAYTAFMCSIL